MNKNESQVPNYNQADEKEVEIKKQLQKKMDSNLKKSQENKEDENKDEINEIDEAERLRIQKME